MKPEGQGRPSGLRNPVAAVRGLAAGTLIMETVVLLLAVSALAALGGEARDGAIAAVVVLAIAAVAVAGLLRHRWAWYAGGTLQILLMLAGFLHWSLGVLGITFGFVWVYVLHVRRTILG